MLEKVEGEGHLEIYEVERRDWNETVLTRPNGLRETLKLQFGVGDLDLPERRKTYLYTSSREEEEEDAQMCHCGKAK